MGLTNKQKQIAEEWIKIGNATKAYEIVYGKAGCRGMAYKILHKPLVQEYIKELQQEARENFFFQLTDAQMFWIETMKNPNAKMCDRLKASELFAKSIGGFSADTNVKVDVRQVIFSSEDDIDE